MRIGNPAITLSKLSDERPVYAALVPVSGNGVTIPFVMNPSSIGTTFAATISESQLFKGNSPSMWAGFKPERYPITGVTLTKGGTYDIRPLIDYLRKAVQSDTVYNYVHGVRVIQSVRVVSGSITETKWIGGVPTEAEASFELMQVFAAPSVKVTVKDKLTEREVKAVESAAVVLGYTKVDLKVDKAKGTISYKSKLLGKWEGGKLVLEKTALKPPTAPAPAPKLVGGATAPITSPTPPKFVPTTGYWPP